MLTIFLMGAVGAACLIFRIARNTLRAIPSANDDVIFF